MKSLIATFFILLASLPAFAADGLRPGYWQVDASMDIPNMPALLTSTSANYCISEDEARDPRRLAFRQKDCNFTAFSKSDKKIAWKMTCSGRNHGTLRGEAQLAGETFRSVMKLRSSDGVSTLQITAKRLGECPRRSSGSVPPQHRLGAGKSPDDHVLNAGNIIP